MISTNQQVNELGSEFPSFSESFDTGPTNLSELSKDSYLITSVHARFLYMSSPFVCPCMLLCIHIFSNCTYTTNQILKHFKLKQKPQKSVKKYLHKSIWLIYFAHVCSSSRVETSSSTHNRLNILKKLLKMC